MKSNKHATEEHDFATDIAINKYQLEVECEQHASTYYYWAKRLADAKSDLNDADDALKLRMAQSDLSYRKNWDDSRYGKQTEASIKAAIETDDEIITAKAALASYQREVNSLTAAVSAMEHRRSELDNLTKQLIGGFYAAPNGGKREGITESVGRDVRANMKRKKETE